MINGDAIIAGSNFNFLASIGRAHPNVFANTTVPISVNPKTIASFISWYWIITLIPLNIANIIPTKNATLISFHIAFSISFYPISSITISRIINVELCEPQFPPVPIIIGINETRSGTAAKASS